MLRTVRLCLLVTIALSGCSDECREYSDFSCSEIQKASYNVYFYFPSGTEKYLEQKSISAKLKACRNAAA